MLLSMLMASARKIHCIGIGGIGLSALAQLLVYQGKEVSGCDREEQPTIELLLKRGVGVCVGHDAGHISADTDLVIFTAAISESHLELARAKQLNIPCFNYFQALSEVSQGMKTVAISGTHGKTTTTGMLAKVLIEAGKSPTVVVGSLLKDFGSNFVAGESNLFVVEACEYRRHFLNLEPYVLVITNLELDHPDYYKNLDDVQDAFRTLVLKVPMDGAVVADLSNMNVVEILSGLTCRIIDYSSERVEGFDLFGEHNMANARAAKAVAKVLESDIKDEVIDFALKSFQGTWRRFEHKGVTLNGAEVYDDYAHHPTAIVATLKAVRNKFPDKKICVLFHPHLYSRTREFFAGFIESLREADEVYILPIYAAREEFDSTVSSIKLAEVLKARGVQANALTDFQEAEDMLKEKGKDTIILTMGAGDVYKVADKLISLYD